MGKHGRVTYDNSFASHYIQHFQYITEQNLIVKNLSLEPCMDTRNDPLSMREENYDVIKPQKSKQKLNIQDFQ